MWTFREKAELSAAVCYRLAECNNASGNLCAFAPANVLLRNQPSNCCRMSDSRKLAVTLRSAAVEQRTLTAIVREQCVSHDCRCQGAFPGEWCTAMTSSHLRHVFDCSPNFEVIPGTLAACSNCLSSWHCGSRSEVSIG